MGVERSIMECSKWNVLLWNVLNGMFSRVGCVPAVDTDTALVMDVSIYNDDSVFGGFFDSR